MAVTNSKRVLFIPDVHVPFHDKKAWAIVLDVVATWKPDVIAIAGDFIDNYAISAHSKDYGRVANWQLELDEANKELNAIETAARKANPKVSFIFTAGNHEFRMDRFLAERVPEDNRRHNDMRTLLRMYERGWKWVAYGDFTRLGKMCLTHDVEGKAGKTAVAQALNDFHTNVVIGHLHRMSVVYEGDARGQTHVGACFGWLGDAQFANYKSRIKANRDWTLGFGIGRMLDNGTIHIQAVPIVDYGCFVEGTYFKSK